MQALVLTSIQLRDMLTEAAKQGAALAVQELRADLLQAPEDVTLQTLRRYLADPASLSNPREPAGFNRRQVASPNPRHGS
ncbi:hypothetical protein [Mesorhizobium sp.]|uniref:hypothetical protein n=1 Tax=Mesorhizobium sp. TaxID=1871066 RepID=UPI0025BDF9B8|nr:hypothetical protein [Mesorhizobium sp.]